MPTALSAQAAVFEAIEKRDWAALERHLTRENTLVRGVNSDGLTPLHVAVRMRDETSVNLLIEYGGRIRAKDRTGKTVLDENPSLATMQTDIVETSLKAIFQTKDPGRAAAAHWQRLYRFALNEETHGYVVDRLATYQSQTLLRELILKDAAAPAPAPAPAPASSSIAQGTPPPAGSSTPPIGSGSSTPPGPSTLPGRKGSVPNLSAVAADTGAPAERPHTPPTPTETVLSPSPVSNPPASTATGSRMTVRRPSVVDPVASANTATGDILKLRTPGTIRRRSVTSTVSDLPASVGELALNVIEAMCSTEADGLLLVRGGMLGTMNALLTSGKMAWIKRVLRLVRHMLQSDSTGELVLKVARMSSQDLIQQWPGFVSKAASNVDMDVLTHSLWICQRLSRFSLFQREAANDPNYIPSISQWLSERYPPSSVASDAIWEILANLSELDDTHELLRQSLPHLLTALGHVAAHSLPSSTASAHATRLAVVLDLNVHELGLQDRTIFVDSAPGHLLEGTTVAGGSLLLGRSPASSSPTFRSAVGSFSGASSAAASANRPRSSTNSTMKRPLANAATGRLANSTDDLSHSVPSAGIMTDELGRSLDGSGRSTPQESSIATFAPDGLPAGAAGPYPPDGTDGSPRSGMSASNNAREDDAVSISSDAGSMSGPAEVRGVSLVAWVQALVFAPKLDEGFAHLCFSTLPTICSPRVMLRLLLHCSQGGARYRSGSRPMSTSLVPATTTGGGGTDRETTPPPTVNAPSLGGDKPGPVVHATSDATVSSPTSSPGLDLPTLPESRGPAVPGLERRQPRVVEAQDRRVLDLLRIWLELAPEDFQLNPIKAAIMQFTAQTVGSAAVSDAVHQSAKRVDELVRGRRRMRVELGFAPSDLCHCLMSALGCRGARPGESGFVRQIASLGTAADTTTSTIAFCNHDQVYLKARDAIISGRLPIGQTEAATKLAALGFHIETPVGWAHRFRKLECPQGEDLLYALDRHPLRSRFSSRPRATLAIRQSLRLRGPHANRSPSAAHRGRAGGRNQTREAMEAELPGRPLLSARRMDIYVVPELSRDTCELWVRRRDRVDVLAPTAPAHPATAVTTKEPAKSIAAPTRSAASTSSLTLTSSAPAGAPTSGQGSLNLRRPSIASTATNNNNNTPIADSARRASTVSTASTALLPSGAMTTIKRPSVVAPSSGLPRASSASAPIATSGSRPATLAVPEARAGEPSNRPRTKSTTSDPGVPESDLSPWELMEARRAKQGRILKRLLRRIAGSVYDEYRRDVADMTESQAKHAFIDCCRNLPTYGALFFPVKHVRLVENSFRLSTLGVSNQRLTLLDPQTDTVVASVPLWAVDRVHSADGVLVVRCLRPPHGVLSNRLDIGIGHTRRATLDDWCLVTEHAAYLKKLIRRGLAALRAIPDLGAADVASEPSSQAVGFTLDLQLNRGCPEEPDAGHLPPPPSLSELAAERAKGRGETDGTATDTTKFASRSFVLRAADAVRNPTELARQLTLLEHRYFRAISRRAILFYVMHPKEREHELAQPVRTFIAHFNKVSDWIASQLVQEESNAGRWTLLRRFIHLASELIKLRNYNGAMEVLSGLNSSPVRKLEMTWKALSLQDVALFNQVDSILSASSNFGAYRRAIAASALPAVPYFGLYLSSLTFVGDGNADSVGSVGLINLPKRRKIMELLDEIARFQKDDYYLLGVPAFQEFLQNLQPLSEDERYALAVQRWEEFQASGGDGASVV